MNDEMRGWNCERKETTWTYRFCARRVIRCKNKLRRTNCYKFMGIVVLVIFWVAVGFAFFVIGAKTALSFAGLWAIGLLGTGALHIAPLFFPGL